MTAADLSKLVSVYTVRPGVSAYAEQERASGQCKEAAFALCLWLRERGEEAAVLNLSSPQGFDVERVARFWRGKMLAFASHYTVKVGDLSVDLTARQFDPEAPFPEILPLSALRQRWLSAYDTSQPLTAGPLWSDG